MDRQALETERVNLERQRKKRLNASSPQATPIAMIDKRLAEIKAVLSAPVQPEGGE